MASSSRGALLVLAATLPCNLQAQSPRIDTYGYVLDIEVPESPALVALGYAPFRVLHANAPKPVSISATSWFNGDWRSAAALDFSILHFVGGGQRTFEDYTANSIRGRLMRVLTKSIVSIGTSSPGLGSRTAVAIRSTFHDPHDPINNSDLVRELDRLGDADPDSPEVTSLFRRTSALMRARHASMWSGGWGMSWNSGPLNPGASRNPRHTAWLAVQQTLNASVDIVVLVQGQSVFQSGRTLRFGGALRRKLAQADVITEAVFDTRLDRIHPGVGVEAKVAHGLRAVVTVGSEDATLGSDRVVGLRMLLRWSQGN